MAGRVFGPYKDSKGKSYFRVTWTEGDKRREKRLRGITRAEAERWVGLRQYRAEMDGFGVTTEAQRITLKEWADRWFRQRALEVQRSTWAKDRQHWDHHVSRLGAYKLAGLTHEVVSSWVRTLPVGAETKGAIYTVLRKIVRAAARHGVFGDKARAHFVLPFAGAAPKKAPQVAREAVRGSVEWAEIVEAALRVGGLEKAVAIVLCLGAGARRSELVRLRWDEHVKLGSDTEGPWVAVVFDGRWAKSKRTRTAEIRGDLAQIVHRFRAESFSPWLFAHKRDLRRRGKVIARAGEAKKTALPDKTWDAIRAVIKKPGLRLHDLRGSYAKELLARGAEPADVMRMMGHVSWETTQRYLEEARAPAVDRAARLLRLDGDIDTRADVEPPKGAAVARLDAFTKTEEPPSAAEAKRPRPVRRSAKSFGKDLAMVRKAAGLRQRDVGEAIAKVDPSQNGVAWGKVISRLEKGRKVRPEAAAIIGGVLSELFGHRYGYVPSCDQNEQLAKARRGKKRRAKKTTAKPEEAEPQLKIGGTK